MSIKIEVVAWWGAVIATIVLIWDVYKWWSAGPKLRLSVQANMKGMNMPDYEGETLIVSEVTNIGDRPTTITHMAILYFKNIWSLMCNKADESYVIVVASTLQPIPHELKPGNIWTGIVLQNDDIEKMIKNGFLYCAVFHSHKKKPIRKRVVMRDYVEDETEDSPQV